MVLGTGTLLVLGALVAAWEARNAGSVGRSFAIDWLWRFSLELTSFALGVALFFVIFKFLPSRRIVWRTALVAAVFCSLGFEVAKRLYALYVTRFATLDRVASDANIVALFLFLLWVYYTAYLFLLGGEVAEMYDLVRMQRSQRVQLG
jgi:membrane protein